MKKSAIKARFVRRGYSLKQHVQVVTPSKKGFILTLENVVTVLDRLSKQGLEITSINFISSSFVTVVQTKDEVDYQTHLVFYPEI